MPAAGDLDRGLTPPARVRALLAAAATACAACASPPEIYAIPDQHYREQQADFGDPGPQIEVGRPLPPLDLLNHWLLSLPTKALLLNWHVLDHELTPEGRALLERYLELNGLTSVKVRHNDYAPIDEFRRLTKNTDVGAGYRYTLGLFTWLQYTLLPDRLLAGVPFIGGGDHFNPFTNTIHVYSSDIAVLLHEAGHAKDYLEHDSRGTSFALLRLVPGIDLLQEARASTDAIRFLQCVRKPEEEARAYKVLIPAYSTYIGGYLEGGLVVFLPVVAAGHVSGRIQSSRREAVMDYPEGHSEFQPPFCVPVYDAGPTSETIE